ncbi:MAG: 3'-5' exonuclease, partial [Bacteroidetes bacterium]|nr:3'-5' exonuclease [Bacteroidota bacterium]
METKRILFLDIETVSESEKLEELSPRMQALWRKKARRFIPFDQKSRPDSEIDWADLYEDRAGIL